MIGKVMSCRSSWLNGEQVASNGFENTVQNDAKYNVSVFSLIGQQQLDQQAANMYARIFLKFLHGNK